MSSRGSGSWYVDMLSIGQRYRWFSMMNALHHSDGAVDAALAWSMGEQVHFFQRIRRHMHWCAELLVPPPDAPDWTTCAIPAERMAEVAQLVHCHLVIIHHDPALAIGSTPESYFFPSASRDIQHNKKVALLYLRQARHSTNALELHLLPVDTRQMPKSLEDNCMDASDGHLLAADACALQLLRLGIAARWGSTLTYKTSLLPADQHDGVLLNGMCAGDACTLYEAVIHEGQYPQTRRQQSV